jgi:hypothetical protein
MVLAPIAEHAAAEWVFLFTQLRGPLLIITSSALPNPIFGGWSCTILQYSHKQVFIIDSPKCFFATQDRTRSIGSGDGQAGYILRNSHITGLNSRSI